MTPSSRLRLLCVRLLGERRMLAVARWVAGPGYTPTLDAYVGALIEAHGLACTGWANSDRKRRALARRRWGRRVDRRDAAWWRLVRDEWNKTLGPVCAEVLTLTVTLAPSPTVCQEPGQYGPSGACVLDDKEARCRT